MSDRAITARGSDIEEAIQKGLKQLGLSRTDVVIDVVDEGRKGLLGLGSREAIVRLTPLPQAGEEAAAEPEAEVEQAPSLLEAEAAPAMPEEEEPAAAPAGHEAEAEEEADEPVQETALAEAPTALPEIEEATPVKEAEAAPAVPEREAEAPEAAESVEAEVTREAEAAPDVDEEVAEAVQEIVETLMEKMDFSGVQVDISYTEPDDKTGRVMTIVAIEDGNELNSLIGPHGETLNDLQYLVRLMTGHVVKRRANFLLDVNGYRRRRKEALTKLAERMASKAVRRGEPVTLEAMNAYDRRLIHIALRDNDEVYTNSVGEGANRRVRIYLQEE